MNLRPPLLRSSAIQVRNVRYELIFGSLDDVHTWPFAIMKILGPTLSSRPEETWHHVWMKCGWWWWLWWWWWWWCETTKIWEKKTKITSTYQGSPRTLIYEFITHTPQLATHFSVLQPPHVRLGVWSVPLRHTSTSHRGPLLLQHLLLEIMLLLLLLLIMYVFLVAERVGPFSPWN